MSEQVDLDKLEALLEEATPGTWRLYETEPGIGNAWVDELPEGSVAIETRSGVGALGQAVAATPRTETAEAVVALRNAASAMIAELRALKSERDELLKREPTQEEADAIADGAAEAFVPAGGWTARRCRVCHRWVFGGPTACAACTSREEKAEELRVGDDDWPTYSEGSADPNPTVDEWRVVDSYGTGGGVLDSWCAIGPWRRKREEAERDAEHGSMRGALPEVHPSSLTTIIDVLEADLLNARSEAASTAKENEAMTIAFEQISAELEKPEDVRLREVCDVMHGHATIFTSLADRVSHVLDDRDEWIERAGSAERRLDEIRTSVSRRMESAQHGVDEAPRESVGQYIGARDALEDVLDELDRLGKGEP